MKNSYRTFGIDGNMFYLMEGEDLMQGRNFFAGTLGEMRRHCLDVADHTLHTGNKELNLMPDSTTPEDFFIGITND